MQYIDRRQYVKVLDTVLHRKRNTQVTIIDGILTLHTFDKSDEIRK